MRYMLGYDGVPQLLVTVGDETPDGFDFRVINGAWGGQFKYNDEGIGEVYIPYTGSTVKGVKVLLSNQDRLRGSYEDVFANFHNENYVAPVPVFNIPENWDDDIAF